MPHAASAPRAQEFRSRPVDVPYALDDGPGRHRIGLVALATDHVIERDFMNMRPDDGVVVYTSRVLNVNPCTVENLRTMGPRITDSTALLLPEGRLDVVAYGCTSGTVAIGYDSVRESIQVARPGIACTTPISAAAAAFARLGVTRIAVLTPYVDEVNATIAAHLEAGGLDVVRFTSFGLADDIAIAGLTPEVVRAAAREADDPEAQALFISCTAVRAVDAIAGMESDLGKPVVSANQAMYWEALRLSGYQAPVPGFGRLLAL